MKNEEALLEILIRNEKSLIDPITRKNPESLYQLLSPTFFEIGCSGKIWQRPDTIKGLSNQDCPNVDATDFKIHHLSTEVVLLTFKTTKFDKTGASVQVLRSSIWKKNGPSWQMEFHQGTKLPQDMST